VFDVAEGYQGACFGSSSHCPLVPPHCDSHAGEPGRCPLPEGGGLFAPIPKDLRVAGRIAENVDVFEFELSPDEMNVIGGLDTDQRGGPEPDAITLEAFGRAIPEP
jgi:hypothetical protein